MDKKIYKLVMLTTGTSSKTGKRWAKIYLKSRNSAGLPIGNELYISPEIADELIKAGAIEDVDVTVNGGLDDYMRPCITEVNPVKATTDSAETDSDFWNEMGGKN